jgi:hypothetical protein
MLHDFQIGQLIGRNEDYEEPEEAIHALVDAARVDVVNGLRRAYGTLTRSLLRCGTATGNPALPISLLMMKITIPIRKLWKKYSQRILVKKNRPIHGWISSP